MSFILDAIAKSEQDRQQQEVPGAHTLALPVGGEQPRRRIWYYLGALALLLNVVMLLIWMTQSDLSRLNLPALSQSDTIEQSSGPAAVSDNSSMKDPVTAFDVAVTENPSKSTIDIVNTPTQPAAATPSTTESIEQTEKTVSNGNSRGQPKPETIFAPRATDTDLEGKSKLTPPQPVAETTGAQDTARIGIEPDTLPSSKIQAVDLTNQSTGEQSASQAMPRKLSRLRDLPADVRRDLPSVEFSGHLYSSNPKSSYVFVNNGRSVTEGQLIADDLFLYKVTPTGVILEFREYLIDVSVLKSWNLY